MTRLQDFAAHQFDYIIIGGGTAGLVLARRLSDRADLCVGVVEAGPAAPEEPAINIPGRYGETLGGKYDWKFETTEQPGLDGRRVPCPRGKVLGGTSALNFMAWNRGNREDYDAWAELGNEGWGWEDLLPFFKRSETFHAPDSSHQESCRSYYQADVHGVNGPVQTTHIREYGPAHQFWHDTLNNLNVETSPDSLGGRNSGAWNMVCSIDPVKQARSYSATAYYYPIKQRPNLVVLEATVTEIICERTEDDWRAAGVRVRCDGKITDIPASKEVVLCAGSIQSPQLLELSGIGSRSVLNAAGIPIRVENPNVGENLQDHMMTATIFEIDHSLPTRDDILSDAELRKSANNEYATSRTGPWTILPCSIAYCPLSTFVSPEELSYFRSRALLIAQETGHPRDEILARQFQADAHLGQIEYLFDVGNWSPFFQSEPSKKYGTMLQMLQYPFSRGSIHIPPRSGGRTTADDHPTIDPQIYLGPGEIDRKVMTMAQKFGKTICETEPLSSMMQARTAPPDDDYDRFVVHNTITDWHPIGTCAMGGKQGDKAGVVDHRLRVYGVRGLRVADASVMPLQVGAHIQATVYAIAEKAAAMILDDIDRSPRAGKA
ncbi:putative choline dehydrogenase [Aspergillus steynii IBT 23096]|uniref:Putative choline dehydrogenase n=1 Tax=Aspergillus steynii IBT 23096 TaxID=1392250 RepID=A0A2I2GAC5_9EURO|nr:putative choline dehydrogenase [Aspergillus steynii IBT 23096]PLB49826.1 putative choline dehydrogenase [Aspergillus steynii IBT 23096]